MLLIFSTLSDFLESDGELNVSITEMLYPQCRFSFRLHNFEFLFSGYIQELEWSEEQQGCYTPKPEPINFGPAYPPSV
jgi:hypothetical protein